MAVAPCRTDIAVLGDTLRWDEAEDEDEDEFEGLGKMGREG